MYPFMGTPGCFCASVLELASGAVLVLPMIAVSAALLGGAVRGAAHVAVHVGRAWSHRPAHGHEGHARAPLLQHGRVVHLATGAPGAALHARVAMHGPRGRHKHDVARHELHAGRHLARPHWHRHVPGRARRARPREGQQLPLLRRAMTCTCRAYWDQISAHGNEEAMGYGSRAGYS